jgi:hypothetical protein
LRTLYPRNRLVVLEPGRRRYGRGTDGKPWRCSTKGWRCCATTTGPRVPGEQALWHLKRGGARALAGDIPGAEDDLRLATTSDAQPWVNGRARLELGQFALRRGERAVARQQAEQAVALCQRGNDPDCVNRARKLARSAHGR